MVLSQSANQGATPLALHARIIHYHAQGPGLLIRQNKTKPLAVTGPQKPQANLLATPKASSGSPLSP